MGMRVSLQHVAYACLDVAQNRLDSWDVLPVFDNVNSQTHYHHHNLNRTASSIGGQAFVFIN
jgi:hypothetical protein